MRIALTVLVCSLAAPAAAGVLKPTHVPFANPKLTGVTAPNVLSPELREVPVAQGSIVLENPNAALKIGYYGFLTNASLVPLVGDLPAVGHLVEASKTEPDKNLYLVLNHVSGPDANYDYGRHFLFQGHETGAGYFTRINLDADHEHKVTLMAATDVNGNPLPTFDGITWDPFAQKLLLTAEGGALGGTWQATLDYPSKVEYLGGSMGKGGDEGIQNDAEGNIWIVEDAGGSNGAALGKQARRPNSFVFRFVPRQNGKDLTRGKLQVLQVIGRDGKAIVFDPAKTADEQIFSDGMEDLHTYGLEFKTRWVTIHDTEVDGNAVFDHNAVAKTKGGTPFKRPENGVFRPGTDFREFFFTETGDTNALTQAGSEFGGFGGIFKLTQDRCDADSGELTMFFQGDLEHTGLDNIAFWSRDLMISGEDRGDTLHGQANALDSLFMLSAKADYAKAANQPVRVLAEGRDPMATLDSQFLGMPGFNNDGDNEVTGPHVSNGDPSRDGILGAQIPTPFEKGWRVFWTQQHGENTTWEILPASDDGGHDHGHDD